ncbi:MAG: homoserine kinase [Alphaproteobacteria bacterium]|nr:homoserine kinase [Alphaproteobacteria bacterium]
MAVYTKISKSELENFLSDYDLGELERFEGITQGVSNTNYHVFTNKNRYVLTIFEPHRIIEKDLPFFFNFSGFLAQKGIKCPQASKDRKGNIVKSLQGRPATLIDYLEGRDIGVKNLTPDHCKKMGSFLARMHKVSSGFDQSRENSMGFKFFPHLCQKVEDRVDEFENGLKIILQEELAFLQENWPEKLPSGVVHADAFPDNVFFNDGDLSAIIDFYFSCTDFYAFDLAIAVNAWCFDENNTFVPERFSSFIEAYIKERPLSEAEKKAFRVLCRGAAFRILASRLEEYFMYDPNTMEMVPHDPAAYLKRLHFHQQEDVLNELA